MKYLFKIMLCFFLLSNVVIAAYELQSGLVESVDLKHKQIVINGQVYKIKSDIRITNAKYLKRGSIVDFILNSDKTVSQLDVRPGKYIEPLPEE